jgi:hypothetical protein
MSEPKLRKYVTRDNGWDAGPDAFPCTEEGVGMGLLDYFAAQALPGLVVGHLTAASSARPSDDIALTSYNVAAAMMRHRKLISKELDQNIARRIENGI